MTTTKMVYVAAAIVPFGFVILAGFLVLHAVYKRRTTTKAQYVAAV